MKKKYLPLESLHAFYPLDVRLIKSLFYKAILHPDE